jgi:hypothetical protein
VRHFATGASLSGEDGIDSHVTSRGSPDSTQKRRADDTPMLFGEQRGPRTRPRRSPGCEPDLCHATHTEFCPPLDGRSVRRSAEEPGYSPEPRAEKFGAGVPVRGSGVRLLAFCTRYRLVLAKTFKRPASSKDQPRGERGRELDAC